MTRRVASLSSSDRIILLFGVAMAMIERERGNVLEWRGNCEVG